MCTNYVTKWLADENIENKLREDKEGSPRRKTERRTKSQRETKSGLGNKQQVREGAAQNASSYVEDLFARLSAKDDGGAIPSELVKSATVIEKKVGDHKFELSASKPVPKKVT